MLPIIDLHCDLLSYLAESPSRTTNDPLSKASFPQMEAGGVRMQVLAVFTTSTPAALSSAKKQLQALDSLLQNQPERYCLFDRSTPIEQKQAPIQVVPAFENACGFAQEGKPIQESFPFLDSLLKRYGNILYISLTWDGENRFGGGVGTKIGLKEDSKRVLEWMDKKNIAIDFSHTSDFLADDIFNYIDKKSLCIPVLASHSNARTVSPLERNLPDAIAKEIFARQGLIGLNFFAPFIGRKYTDLAEHIAHFFALGGEEKLCFGADFFPDFDLSDYFQKKYGVSTGFFQELSNSSCYPSLLSLLEQQLTKEQLKGLSHKNFLTFTKKNQTTGI